MNDQPVVQAAGLEIGYGHEVIVPSIDFTLEPGQSLALVGINGSGKSTLLKTLVGLLPPLRGDLRVLGARPGASPKRIAYLSQFHASGFILPLRAIDAVRMGRFSAHGLLGRMTAEDEQLVRAAMERMGIADLADKSLRALSGGQQQRVYIAQTLCKQAKLLILDEPTAGLDAGGREIYQQVIQEELKRGTSVVVATHDLQEAMSCDLAMLLARKVIAFGPGQQVVTPAALLETFGIVVTLDQQKIGVTVIEREHGHTH